MNLEDKSEIIKKTETVIIDTDIITVKAIDIIELTPPNAEEDILISQICELTKKISCSSAYHMGSLNDYEKIIQILKSNSDKTIPLNLDLTGLQNFANLASELEKFLSCLEIYFKQNYKISYIVELQKIYQYLVTINNMLEKFEQLVLCIKAHLIVEFPSTLVDINKNLEKVLSTLKHITQDKPCSCELDIVKRSIRREKCNIKKINHKLRKLECYQSKLDNLAFKLSSKNKYC